MDRIDITFDSSGTCCAAWLYQPNGKGPHPCVILGHGFGAIRQMRLDAYAERFAQAGLAAFVFDYRHFGASGGEPRQLLDIKQQLADWAAAISYVRTLDSIDVGRIALWGASLAGGHVVEIAAQNRRIAAVVAVVPFLDGFAVLRASDIRQDLPLAIVAMRDELQELLKKPPCYVKLVGAPNTCAVITSSRALEGVRAMIPENVDVPNCVAARVLLHLGCYRPIERVSQVECPLLVCACDRDLVALPEPATKAARIAPQGELLFYHGSHFDIFVGELFEQAVAAQSNFLARCLLDKE